MDRLRNVIARLAHDITSLKSEAAAMSIVIAARIPRQGSPTASDSHRKHARQWVFLIT
jgi:hypothetical protein